MFSQLDDGALEALRILLRDFSVSHSRQHVCFCAQQHMFSLARTLARRGAQSSLHNASVSPRARVHAPSGKMMRPPRSSPAAASRLAFLFALSPSLAAGDNFESADQRYRSVPCDDAEVVLPI
jgi:hypothetical protein